MSIPNSHFLFTRWGRVCLFGFVMRFERSTSFFLTMRLRRSFWYFRQLPDTQPVQVISPPTSYIFLSLLISIQLFLSPKTRKHRLTNGFVITDSVTITSSGCDCSPSNEQLLNLTKFYFLNRSKTP